MIEAMGIKIGILLLLLSGTVSVIEAQPTLTLQPAAPNTGLALTLTCELAGFTTDLMNFKKDGTTVYSCGSGGVPCVNNGGISDYSQVDWSQVDKGIVTISNADQTRDGGDWTCAVGGGGGTSVAVTLAVTDADCGNPTKPTHGQVSFTTTTYKSTATYSCDSGYTIDTTTTTCQADGTWSAVPTCTGTTVSPSTTTTIPGTTVTSTTTGTTNHTGGPTTNTIPPTTDSPSSLPVSEIIAIVAGVGLVIVIGVTIAIVCYCKRKSKIKETVDDRHSSGIDNHDIDLKEHSKRDHHL